jgi:uncharacterized protein (DUF924 family)
LAAGGLLQRAKLGALAHWAENPDSALALVILLDQLSRNIHRGTPEAFATDPLALETAKQAIAQGYDLRLTPEGRSFLYLPFEHSEALADQERGVALFEALGWRKRSTICAGTARSSRALDASRIAMPFSGASRRPRRSNF